MTAPITDAVTLNDDARRAIAVISRFPLPGSGPLSEFRELVPRICDLLSTPGPRLSAVWDDVTEKGSVPVRVYVPPQASRDVLVYARGSGWVAGSIDAQDPLVRRLAFESRSPILSVEYRLAPEHPFPAALDDVLSTIASATRLLERAGMKRPEKIGVAGQSAGGNLAAAAAIALRDRGEPLDLQVLIDPVLQDHRRTIDLEAPVGDFAGIADVLRWEWDQYLPGQPDRAALPLAAPAEVTTVAGLAPAVVVTAEHDILKYEAAAYARRLQAVGVLSAFHEAPGAIHGFLDHTRMGDAAERHIRDIAALIRQAWTRPG